LPLEKWMLFAIYLGEITNLYKKESINIYLSLPNNLLFSYFFILGVIDNNMKQKVSDEVILEQFKKLNEGDIIYYLDNGVWKKCSVIGLVNGYTNEKSWHLQILNNKKTIQYIPSSKWRYSIVLTNENRDSILNARKVNDFQSISTGKLQHIYSLEQLQTLELLNEPYLFISGNKKDFYKYLSSICFYYYTLYDHQVQLTFKDFIHDGTDVNYKNIEWLSKSLLKKYDIAKIKMVLFIGSNKALSHLNTFKNSSKIILDDRHDNTETSDLLRLSIEQEILSNQSTIITNELNEILEEKNVSVPWGVEFLAWK